MRSFAIRIALIGLGLFLWSTSPASRVCAQAPSSDVIMVLSFENTSNRPEYNWVGESFADSLTELLNRPGLIVVSSNERALAYQRVGLPQTMIPSRATSIKLAREARATMIVLGTYTVTPPQEDPQAAKAKPDKDKSSVEAYVQAAFELGRFYMREAKWKEASDSFIKLQKKEPHYAEASFYAGLAYAKMGDFGHALASLVPLASDMPLIGVYNNAGAVAVQAARDQKKDQERQRLLAQGISFLERAAGSSHDDSMVRFNYAY